MPPASALQLLLELRHEPTAVPGWRTKWQLCCELFWKSLEEQTAASPAVTDFINILLQKHMFALARLSIAELRSSTSSSEVAQRNQILTASTALRLETIRQESFHQGDVDDVLYAAEKRIALHAELHRARVLLHHSGGFGSRESELEEWLAAHPDMLGKPDDSGDDAVESSRKSEQREESGSL